MRYHAVTESQQDRYCFQLQRISHSQNMCSNSLKRQSSQMTAHQSWKTHVYTDKIIEMLRYTSSRYTSSWIFSDMVINLFVCLSSIMLLGKVFKMTLNCEDIKFLKRWPTLPSPLDYHVVRNSAHRNRWHSMGQWHSHSFSTGCHEWGWLGWRGARNLWGNKLNVYSRSKCVS